MLNQLITIPIVDEASRVVSAITMLDVVSEMLSNFNESELREILAVDSNAMKDLENRLAGKKERMIESPLSKFIEKKLHSEILYHSFR